MSRPTPPTSSGAYRLSDMREPRLDVVCRTCDRRGSYGVAELIAEHGDMSMPSFLMQVITPSCTNRNTWGQCQAVYANPPGRLNPAGPA